MQQYYLAIRTQGGRPAPITPVHKNRKFKSQQLPPSGTWALPRYTSIGSPGHALKRFDVSQKIQFRKTAVHDVESVSPSPAPRHGNQLPINYTILVSRIMLYF